ncbi:hypothetical protein SpCBS45565_g00045 [Spizellomyces sp. 'palustris']|nr:hypothetical protein SpCBS45565_g00045 [Spizellomyces sp. 'palustris']
MDVSQCIANVEVSGHFEAIKNATVNVVIEATKNAVTQQVTTITIPAVIKQVTLAYGGPGILLGTTWPIVLATALIIGWRLYGTRSVRTWFLFVAVILNMVDCANVSWARSTPKAELNIDAHFMMAIIFSQMKMAFLASAGAWRFGQVFTQTTHKRLVIWSLTIFFMGWALAESILGCIEVSQSHRVSKVYWGMTIGIPIVYFTAGGLTFTRVLKMLEDELSSLSNMSKHCRQNNATFTYLRISNNIAIAITFLCAISVLFVSQTWDSITNLYVLPGTLLLSTTWNFAESMFEVFTIFQKVASQSPSTTT